jgi:hypothetical protein
MLLDLQNNSIVINITALSANRFVFPAAGVVDFCIILRIRNWVQLFTLMTYMTFHFSPNPDSAPFWASMPPLLASKTCHPRLNCEPGSSRILTLMRIRVQLFTLVLSGSSLRKNVNGIRQCCGTVMICCGSGSDFLKSFGSGSGWRQCLEQFSKNNFILGKSCLFTVKSILFPRKLASHLFSFWLSFITLYVGWIKLQVHKNQPNWQLPTSQDGFWNITNVFF